MPRLTTQTPTNTNRLGDGDSQSRSLDAAHAVSSKLVAIRNASFGSELELADNSRIALGVTCETIRDHVTANGFGELQSFVDGGRIDVFHRPVSVSAADWYEVSRIARNCGALAILPGIRSLLSLDHAEFSALPCRLYGGIGIAADDLAPVFYTSPAADFLPDENRGPGCFFYSFAASGFDIHKIFVDVSMGRVVVESGNVPYHFLEDRLP